MMEALARNPALKAFSENWYGVSKFSGNISGLTIQTVRLPKLKTGITDVLQQKTVGSSSIACVLADLEADLSPEQAEIQATHELRTVHVKFILQKQCLFGEHFLLVGGEPIFGLWDPADAVPLQWAEEHIWTAELDIPIAKQIQFKYILKGASGEVKWQPGPDRILQTWETNKTIVVAEDWEKAELQVIREEEVVAEDWKNSELQVIREEVVAEDWKNSELQVIREEVVTEDREKAELQVIIEEESKNQGKEPRDVVLAESVVDGTKESENNPISLRKQENVVTINEETPVENRVSMNEEIHVLVPGLTSSPVAQSAPEELNQGKELMANNPRDLVLSKCVVNGTKESENNPINLKKQENPATMNEEIPVESPVSTNEEIPVLVSGLIPSPIPQSAPEEFCLKNSMDEASAEAFLATEEVNSQMAPKKHENTMDEPKAIDETPPEEFNDHASSSIEGVSGDVLDRITHSVDLSQQAPDTDNVFEHDIQWGKKILDKLIVGMGFGKSHLS